ncbi:MAG: hypothetical protein FWH27_17650, partial [Planctomycetaceae bacterium]|nr:hypothetical protein [Planctomycetaceae bacterium]
MSSLLIFRQYFVKFRVTIISAVLLVILFGLADAQRGNRGTNDVPDDPPPLQAVSATPQTAQVQSVPTVVIREEDDAIVTTTTSGDDVSVVRTAPGQDRQGGFQPGQGGPGQRGQGQGGQGGFQPGQGAPVQPAQLSENGQPEGVQPQRGPQQGQPGQRPNAPRADRATINPPNPDIRPEDFNRTGENRGLRIAFQGAPWRTVIEWFASEAGLSLELESAPPGSFSYRDETDKTYTIDETFSLLNSYLIRRNFLMFRTAKLLMLANLADGLPDDLIRDVPLEKLDVIGDYEVVRVLFNLTGTTPDVVQTEIQQFLGPQGRVVALPRSQQIYVTEFGDKLRTIREIIRGIDDPSVASVFEIVTLKNIATDIAVTQLKQLLPLADNDATLRVAIDPTGTSILMTGRVDRIAAAKRLLTMIDIPTDPSGVEIKVYPIPSADPRTALAIVQTLLAGRPDVRAQLDSNIGALVVQGRAEDHAKVVKALKELEDAGYKTVGIYLSRLSTSTAKEAIDNYFSSGTTTQQRGGAFQVGGTGATTTNTSTVPAPIVTPVSASKQLIIKGTESQITQIKILLTQMGERMDGDGTVGLPDRLRSVPMSEKQAEIVLQMAQQMWSQMGNRQINVTTPAQLLSPTPGVRVQPMQFNNRQPGQPLGSPYRQQPEQPVPYPPVTLPTDGVQLPSYLDNTPP